MKLYYSPGACSLASHIALREAGVPFELVRVDLARGKQTSDGSDFLAINPKGYVAALVLDDGALLTEGAVIAQYAADLRPEADLAPRPGTFERVRLQEWLNFIASELHKGFGPLLSPKASEEYKADAKNRLAGRLEFLARSLEGKQYLLGDRFSVADGYAYWVLRMWVTYFKAELGPTLAAYYARIGARPAVRDTLAAEGLAA